MAESGLEPRFAAPFYQSLMMFFSFTDIKQTLWTPRKFRGRVCNRWYLADLLQLRITAASPGKVDFELDIQKDHTVGSQTR